LTALTGLYALVLPRIAGFPDIGLDFVFCATSGSQSDNLEQMLKAITLAAFVGTGQLFGLCHYR
jgi:hypothetical protein